MYSGSSASGASRGNSAQNVANRSARGYSATRSSAPYPQLSAGNSWVRRLSCPGSRSQNSPFLVGTKANSPRAIRSNEDAPIHGTPWANAKLFANTMPTRTPVNDPGPRSAANSFADLSSAPVSCNPCCSRRRQTAPAFRFAASLAANSTSCPEIRATLASGLDVLKAMITGSN